MVNIKKNRDTACPCPCRHTPSPSPSPLVVTNEQLGMASALETLCWQAFGAKKHHMLGIYLQRSWIVLFLYAAALMPTYVFTEDLLLLLGQTPELSRLAGKMSVWLILQHFAMAMLLSLTRFLQSQLKNWVAAATARVTLALHVLVTYLLVSLFQLGYTGVVAAADVAWWVIVLGQLFYVVCDGRDGAAAAGLWP